jgi:Holliday junction DNA helicase RuvA
MIGRLTGKVAHDDGDAIVVDVNGVGYELHVPLGTVGRVRADADGRATFFVHTKMSEDALTLYGFASDAEREAFRTLIGVSNVGPKIAMAVLSALPADDLARAIAHKDIARLTAISGVGKKTAERLVLELRDKLKPSGASSAAIAAAPRATRGPASGNEELLRSALANMSFRPGEVDRAVAQLADRVDGSPLPELIREALAVLAR